MKKLAAAILVLVAAPVLAQIASQGWNIALGSNSPASVTVQSPTMGCVAVVVNNTGTDSNFVVASAFGTAANQSIPAGFTSLVNFDAFSSSSPYTLSTSGSHLTASVECTTK